MRKALDYLENNKFILRQQGRGTYVMDPAGREVMRRFERFRTEDGDTLGQALEVLSHEEDTPTPIESENLQLAKDARVRRMIRIRRRKTGVVFLFEQIALPCDLFPTHKDVGNPEMWISTTARNCGVLLGDAEEKISLAPCPSDVAPHLGLAVDTNVMRIRGVMSTIEGRPARWRDAYALTDGIYYSVPLTRGW